MDAQRGGVLIVGAGQAGVQLAASLRELGHDGPITLVGDEPHLPYQRPPLSKAVLLGRPPAGVLGAVDASAPAGATASTAGMVELRSERYYADAGIELVRGDRVVRVELPDDFPAGAGAATTVSGRLLVFDRLALCLGGRPRTLDLPGAGLGGVHYLRSLDDALALRARVADARDVVVVGGGFIGLETAAAAAATTGRRTVTVLEAAGRLLERAVAPAVSDHIARVHARTGVDVRLGASVAGFEGDGQVRAVRLASGEEIPADLVVVGVGLRPSTGLARRAGLDCAGAGIVVDERARTSRPGVVAAGDCTVGRDGVRLESVQNAVAQARQAAAALLGRPAPATGVPWFWSDQGDLKLQIAGLSAGHDATVTRGAPERDSFSVLYYRGGRLIAIDAVNAPRDFLAVRRLLQSGGTIPAHLAGAAEVPLKTAA